MKFLRNIRILAFKSTVMNKFIRPFNKAMMSELHFTLDSMEHFISLRTSSDRYNFMTIFSIYNLLQVIVT